MQPNYKYYKYPADLIGEKHLDLELRELLPEREVRGPLGDELVRVELPLQRLLVLVVLGVPETEVGMI